MKLRQLAPPENGTVGCYPLISLARSLSDAGVPTFSNPQGGLTTFHAKAASKLRVPRNLARSAEGPVIVPMMGFSEYRTLPFSLRTEIIPYCFDCWPADYARWRSFFLRHRTRLAFFTARQSAAHFTKELPQMRALWLPEATDPADYDGNLPLAERSIDVLELGRKNDRFHSIVAARLARAGHCHLFEQVKGQIIFADRRALAAGLGNAKISICFPCSQTHPDRSGPIETVTHRYFESIASKCVVLGHCPAELRELFGYNPVVEADAGREIEQINSLLGDISQYEYMVGQNYERLLEVATWDVRVPVMIEQIGQALSASVMDDMAASAA